MSDDIDPLRRPFGERLAGKSKPSLSSDEAPPSFRNSVWNRLEPMFNERRYNYDRMTEPPLIQAEVFLRRLALRKAWLVDELPSDDMRRKVHLRDWLLRHAAWDEVYEVVEDGCELGGITGQGRDRWPGYWNDQFEELGSPYRFVGSTLTLITSESELEEIGTAAGHPPPFDAASEHIAKAAAFLGKRPVPDYHNAVKEALSGMESAIRIAADKRAGDFRPACDAFRDKFGLHAALTKAAATLFGYGSDEGGVRHAKTEPNSDLSFAEAHLVLVHASAWVNYVTQVASEAPK